MAQPLKEIGAICRRHDVLLYVDATATLGGAFERPRFEALLGGVLTHNYLTASPQRQAAGGGQWHRMAMCMAPWGLTGA